MDDRTTIHEFIQELLRRRGEKPEFRDDEPLITEGRLQSIDALEILLLLEEKYGVDLSAFEFDQDQVESVDNILALIGNYAK